MPAGTKYASDSILQACHVLRDYFRIHKPMEVSTGLHVHLGHKHGWNLLHLKRFATLWSMAEDALIHVHRKDRGSEYMQAWCASMRHRSKLAMALFSEHEIVRAVCSTCLPTTAPDTKRRYEEMMETHMPTWRLSEDDLEFVSRIWQYESLDLLCNALRGGASLRAARSGIASSCRPAVRIRITGDKRSEDAKGGAPQTIEVRTMHGTLDGIQ